MTPVFCPSGSLKADHLARIPALIPCGTGNRIQSKKKKKNCFDGEDKREHGYLCKIPVKYLLLSGKPFREAF
jgi:hypothetical protein